MGDKNSNAKGVSPHLIMKPISIWVIEAICWFYIALGAVFVIWASCSAYSGKCGTLGDAIIVGLVCLVPLSLPIGMLLSLRNGARALCLCLHAVLALLVEFVFLLLRGQVDVAVFMLLLLVYTFVSLFSSDAACWCKKMRDKRLKQSAKVI